MTAYPSVPTPTVSAPEQVSVYVDGFNFYHGLMAKGWGRYRWLDFRALLNRRIRDGQELSGLRYFTALVTHQPHKLARQDTYLRALDRHCAIKPVLGAFEMRKTKCAACGDWYKRPQEKRTDVSIATRLLADAYEGIFDVAYLVCADGDLLPAVEQVQRMGKRVCLIDPPKRHSEELAGVTGHHWHFTRSHLAGSLLPNPVEWIDRRGKVRRIYAPAGWVP